MDPGQATERKTVNQGQATKMQKPPGRDDVMTGVTRDVPSTRSQGTVPCDTRYVPRQQATVPCEVAKHLHGSQESDRQKIQSRMLTNVTQFLDQASEVKNKEAKEKLKWEQICNSPGPGFQRGQLLPASAFNAGLTKGKYIFVQP